MAPRAPMTIDVWSDVACPFCYVGKRRLLAALAAFPHRDEVQVIWRAFQLQPELVTDATRPLEAYLAERFSASPDQVKQMNGRVQQMAKPEGIAFAFDKVVLANTFDAHRLWQLAQHEKMGDEAAERLMSAYFQEGRNVDDPAVLADLGAALELSRAGIARVLEGDGYADAVRRDLEEARELGITGVPFFLFDRKYAISGAQPAPLFAQAIAQAHGEWRTADQAEA